MQSQQQLVLNASAYDGHRFQESPKVGVKSHSHLQGTGGNQANRSPSCNSQTSGNSHSQRSTSPGYLRPTANSLAHIAPQTRSKLAALNYYDSVQQLQNQSLTTASGMLDTSITAQSNQDLYASPQRYQTSTAQPRKKPLRAAGKQQYQSNTASSGSLYIQQKMKHLKKAIAPHHLAAKAEAPTTAAAGVPADFRQKLQSQLQLLMGKIKFQEHTIAQIQQEKAKLAEDLEQAEQTNQILTDQLAQSNSPHIVTNYQSRQRLELELQQKNDLCQQLLQSKDQEPAEPSKHQGCIALIAEFLRQEGYTSERNTIKHHASLEELEDLKISHSKQMDDTHRKHSQQEQKLTQQLQIKDEQISKLQAQLVDVLCSGPDHSNHSSVVRDAQGAMNQNQQEIFNVQIGGQAPTRSPTVPPEVITVLQEELELKDAELQQLKRQHSSKDQILYHQGSQQSFQGTAQQQIEHLQSLLKEKEAEIDDLEGNIAHIQDRVDFKIKQLIETHQAELDRMHRENRESLEQQLQENSESQVDGCSKCDENAEKHRNEVAVLFQSIKLQREHNIDKKVTKMLNSIYIHCCVEELPESDKNSESGAPDFKMLRERLELDLQDQMSTNASLRMRIENLQHLYDAQQSDSVQHSQTNDKKRESTLTCLSKQMEYKDACRLNASNLQAQIDSLKQSQMPLEDRAKLLKCLSRQMDICKEHRDKACQLQSELDHSQEVVQKQKHDIDCKSQWLAEHDGQRQQLQLRVDNLEHIHEDQQQEIVQHKQDKADLTTKLQQQVASGLLSKVTNERTVQLETQLQEVRAQCEKLETQNQALTEEMREQQEKFKKAQAFAQRQSLVQVESLQDQLSQLKQFNKHQEQQQSPHFPSHERTGSKSDFHVVDLGINDGEHLTSKIDLSVQDHGNDDEYHFQEESSLTSHSHHEPTSPERSHVSGLMQDVLRRKTVLLNQQMQEQIQRSNTEPMASGSQSNEYYESEQDSSELE